MITKRKLLSSAKKLFRNGIFKIFFVILTYFICKTVFLTQKIREKSSSEEVKFRHVSSININDIQKIAPKPRSKSLSYLMPNRHRFLVEDNPIPKSWTETPELSKRLEERRQRVRNTCKKYNLDRRSEANKPNAWEFMIEKNHALVWCPVFKAASSTWMYNFNILAGYNEKYLLHARDTPITLARKKYPRPSIAELDEGLSSKNRTIAFMIVRHPLERLVSAYRDKFLSLNAYYRSISKTMIERHPELGVRNEAITIPARIHPKTKKLIRRAQYFKVPTFSQFVQFIIESSRDGSKLDEHWTTFNQFCTPCLVDFDVYAKMETLDEDANYVIFKSEIQDHIHPKLINRSKRGPTDAVALKYYCQLTKKQFNDLVDVYKIDFELFDYDYLKYSNCSTSNVTINSSPETLKT